MVSPHFAVILSSPPESGGVPSWPGGGWNYACKGGVMDSSDASDKALALPPLPRFGVAEAHMPGAPAGSTSWSPDASRRRVRRSPAACPTISCR